MIQSIMKKILGTILIVTFLIMSANSQSIKSDADVEKILPELSNWGRWGKQDQLGTLNFLTTKQTANAAKLVKTGETVVLARQTDFVKNPNVVDGKRELIKKPYVSRDFTGAIWHGFAVTHLDALCHIFADESSKMYNGFSVDELTKEGAGKLGIEKMAERGIVGRGVLLDISKVKTIEPGTPIYIKDLEATAKRQKVKIQSGDILFVRTGLGTRNTREKRAGLHPETLVWIKEKEIALLGGDGDSDVAPLENFDRWASAYHAVGIPYLGLPLIDNAELDTLAEMCEKEKRWEFFVTIAPWNLVGGTSSPINPIAVF